MNAAFWSLFGIAVAIIIYWLQKKSRYPSELSFTISFFSPVLQHIPMNFSDISLKYQGSCIKKDLFYVDFMVFNTRNADVGLPNTISSMSIVLPPKTKWIDILVKKESVGIGSTVKINSGDLSEAFLGFHMMKAGESIRLEGLIEASSLDFLSPDESFISFKHRIHDLDKLKFVPFISDSKCRHSKKTLRHSLIWLILLIGSLSALMLVPQNSNVLYKKNNTDMTFVAGINPSNEIVVNQYGKLSHSEVITVDDFKNNYHPVIQYKRNQSVYFSVAICSLALLMYLFMVVDELKDIYRHRIIKKIRDGQ